MTYNGTSHLTESGSSIRTAPLFETSDARYAWLNTMRATPGSTGFKPSASADARASS